jgi:predicted DNA-binding transcriptional regulator AlpA
VTDPTIRLYRGPDTLSPRKLARKLGVCLRTLWRWIAKGKIPQGTRQGKYLVWHVAELPADLAEYGRKLRLAPGDRFPVVRYGRIYWRRWRIVPAPLSAVG